VKYYLFIRNKTVQKEEHEIQMCLYINVQMYKKMCH